MCNKMWNSQTLWKNLQNLWKNLKLWLKPKTNEAFSINGGVEAVDGLDLPACLVVSIVPECGVDCSR